MIISHIVELLLLVLFSALIGFGFNKMQEPDMIFEWYKEWLNKLPYIKHTYSPLELIENSMISNVKPYRKSMFLYYFTKPLGLCIICNTTWIGIMLTLILLPIPISIRIFCAICVGVASASIVIFLENLFKLIQKSI